MLPTRTQPLTLLIIFVCFVVILLDRIQLFSGLHQLAVLLYSASLNLAACTLLLGVINVLWWHLRRVQSGQSEWTHSLALVISLVTVLAAGLVTPNGIDNPLQEWFFDALIAPGQAAIFALLPLFMTVAAYRYLRIGRAGAGWLLTGAGLMLLAQIPGGIYWLPVDANNALHAMINGPILAALRGAILGSALALAITGLRLLIGRT